ncbi:hypothetical protein [Actinoplanes sp. NPDC051859]|uniref:hypothetical protein n=1 Tax=Actinoplanes sp. NPDC051859 TaxID=3363909 RepID=UPI00379D1040
MMIRDLVTPFAAFAAAPAGDDLVGRWRAQVVEPHAELHRAIAPWLDPADAARQLPDLVQRRADLVSRGRRAHEAVQRAAVLLRQVLPDAGAVDAVVLVGLGRANGWATAVSGVPTLFIAVDKLPEPGYDVALALHELLHAEHLRRAARDWPEDRVDADLFREGLAVHLTARLLPEIDASGQLWFEAGQDGWIDRCARAEPVLRHRALAELRRSDVSTRWFSGASDRVGELPGRCGYWLGWRLVEHLLADTPLEVALHWSLPDVSTRLQHLLELPNGCSDVSGSAGSAADPASRR